MTSSLPVTDKTKVYHQNAFFQEMRAGFYQTCDGGERNGGTGFDEVCDRIYKSLKKVNISAEKAGLFGLPSGWVRIAYPESGYTTRRNPMLIPKHVRFPELLKIFFKLELFNP
jgi:hypothetical protein